MLRGLDLFTGIGGLTKALQDYVQPIAYCEIDKYAQAVLLSRMADNELPIAPIWDDIKTLHGHMLPKVDIIYGGFPCQDISVAGLRAGLEGKRSSLFFELLRLATEIKPSFIFLENVSAIRTKGLDTIIHSLSEISYDCRWTTLQAKHVGSPHKRERWFLLAYSKHHGLSSSKILASNVQTISNNQERTNQTSQLERSYSQRMLSSNQTLQSQNTWISEPNVDRVVDGLPYRVDRVKGLGNAVVPLQAKEAFERLMFAKVIS